MLRSLLVVLFGSIVSPWGVTSVQAMERVVFECEGLVTYRTGLMKREKLPTSVRLKWGSDGNLYLQVSSELTSSTEWATMDEVHGEFYSMLSRSGRPTKLRIVLGSLEESNRTGGSFLAELRLKKPNVPGRGQVICREATP